ncbi:MAG: S8 family serine peptidase [Candidatus Pacearchaeota archaeon]|nr:S8 family serine peptidase [Candidatus Pacearchaeota archaeon]
MGKKAIFAAILVIILVSFVYAASFKSLLKSSDNGLSLKDMKKKGILTGDFYDSIQDSPDRALTIIVSFDKKPKDYKSIIKDNGGKILYDYDIIEGLAIEVSSKDIEKLGKIKGLNRIEQNQIHQIFLNDTIPLIGANESWGLGYDGEGIRVCVLDTGINYSHPALGGCTQNDFLTGNCKKVIAGWNFVDNNNNPYDDNSHGTHVAGIIASNDTRLRGVAYNASLLIAKVCNAQGVCDGAKEIAGIQWCVSQGAEIISMSLGSIENYTNYCDMGDSLYDTISAAVNAGIFFSVASGNNYNTTGISSPACNSKVTSVGATKKDDTIADYTNRGKILDLLAPGSAINSTINGTFGLKQGTSMAAPHVAGLAALMLQKIPELTPAQLEYFMKQTGKPIPDADSGLTFPRINASAAVRNSFKMGTLQPYTITDYTDVGQNQTSYFKVGVKCVGGPCGNVFGLLNWSYNGTSLIYDTGTSNSCFNEVDVASEFAVRFTPLSYPFTIKKVRFYTFNTNSFNLHIREDNSGGPGADLITPLEVTPTSGGWVEKNLPQPVTISSGDFYVSYEELIPHNGIYVDDSTNDERSWYSDGSSWFRLYEVTSNYNRLMIRVNDYSEQGIVPATPGAKPFFTTSNQPQTCENMNDGNTCDLAWNVNATGDYGLYSLFALFNSSYPLTPALSNKTIITIETESISITLGFSSISFGNVNPGDTKMISSYNVTIDATTNVNVDLYQKGTNFSVNNQNISIQNMNWINDSTNQGAAFTMKEGYDNKIENIASGGKYLNMTYWLSIPAGQTAADYESQITIKAVKTGTSP